MPRSGSELLHESINTPIYPTINKGGVDVRRRLFIYYLRDFLTVLRSPSVDSQLLPLTQQYPGPAACVTMM